MPKKMSVGVKVALITAASAILTTVLIVFFQKSNSAPDSDKNVIQSSQTQSTTVNVNIPNDTVKPKEEKSSLNAKVDQKDQPINTKNETKKESKNEIINNAPNQGVQINENKGIVIAHKPIARKFTSDDAKKILSEYSKDYPITIWLKGANTESRNLFDQVSEKIQELGYNNISRNIAVMYASSELVEKDFEYHIEGGRLVFSIYPQQ